MKLLTVKNNQTGETKGLDVTATLDLTYFDLVQEHINNNPDDYDNDEIKALMGGWDIGLYTDFKSALHDLDAPLTVGRYTITPIN